MEPEKNLCKEIVNIFGNTLREIFKREANETKYMKQSILGCRFRAWYAIIVTVFKSFRPMYRVLALAIAKHRCEMHGDKTQGLQKRLKRSMSVNEITSATKWGWVL